MFITIKCVFRRAFGFSKTVEERKKNAEAYFRLYRTRHNGFYSCLFVVDATTRRSFTKARHLQRPRIRVLEYVLSMCQINFTNSGFTIPNQ